MDIRRNEKRPVGSFYAKTSGEGSAEIAIRVVGVPAVHVRAVGINVAHVHQLAIRVPAFLRIFPSKAATIRFYEKQNGLVCMITRALKTWSNT